MLRKKLIQDILLKDLLKNLFPETSTATFKKWLKKERIRVDQQVITVLDTLLKKGSDFCLSKPKKFLEDQVEILEETREYIVLNKPEGLLSVDKDFSREKSLHRMLKNYLSPQKVFVLHRLDKETSGLIVFAKTERFYLHGKEALKKRSMKRQYLALVEGKPEPEKGVWKSYLFEDKNLYMRVTANEKKGLFAQSHYQVLGSYKGKSLLAIELLTGRKNQIRIHCQHFSHPIIGDKKYGSQKKGSKRLMLHASFLAFPSLQEGSLSFSAPPPLSFSQHLSKKLYELL